MDLENDASPITRGILKQELQLGFQAFRIEIGDMLKKLTIHMLDLHNQSERRIDRLEEKMDNRFREMNGRFDYLFGEIATYGRETITIPKILDQHGKRLDDHERRIRTLES